MLFACICWDKPHMGEIRERTHHRHLAYLKSKAEIVHIGGPFENADGGIVGTMIIVDVEGEAAARSFIDHEPFHEAGVFETVRLRRWRQMQPDVEPGADAAVDRAAEVRAEQEHL
ncbi:YciI family protein [Methylobacterium sp. J-030]|uniref:YciI family protein n=1 Tax=Methylobacterium sp. J-030 TaxID=2836627 RepID=UPI001FBB6D77|nr:YciI family protein [Methylobacterium sp. J-030]MCJ2067960.1 YciI family protein [Methylobacterium sp. J-030]